MESGSDDSTRVYSVIIISQKDETELSPLNLHNFIGGRKNYSVLENK
jgi:hypothetical protein